MTGSLYGMLDFMIGVCGLYVIVQYVMMVTTGKLRQNMLLPKDINLNKCSDTAGYIKYIGIKQLAFGIAATLSGLLGMIQDMGITLNPFINLGATILFIITVVWYMIAYKKAMRTYWGMK